MTDAFDTPQALVLTSVHKGIATITLNRAKALNALNLEMVQAMSTALIAWTQDPAVIAVVLRSNSPKALSAGGDIRYFHQAASAGQFDELDDFFAQEYALNLRIANYPKPYIAIMQGVVMGGGMGISATASLRIVTDNSKLAMPETKIGLFPDVGGTHFLSHLSGYLGDDIHGTLGVYLGLTGTVIDAASARFAGLADVYCPQDQLDSLFERMAEHQFVDGAAVLHHLRSECAAFAVASSQTAPRNSSLAAHAAWIESTFAGDDVHAVVTRLNAMTKTAANDASAWAKDSLNALSVGSPLMVHVTLKAIRNARKLSLEQALGAERRLMKQCFAHGEPTEGIRALAVDKDHAPKWAHTDINSVSDQELAALFV